jgi:cytochrome c oxidase subunit I
MSYQLNASIHNTQWVTGHFHLIFGGAVVIMYFALAYDLWPHLTGRSLPDVRLVRAQLWLWFIGMIVTTFPWHWVGILGMPRRMAYFDYTDPALSPQALPVTISAIGAFILLTSGLLFLFILARAYTASRTDAGPYRFSLPIHPVRSVPLALNSYGIWVALMIGLTVTNYGYPIAALVARQDTSVPAIYVGAQ